MKSAVVVDHKPEEMARLDFRLAEYENVPLVVTDLEPPELEKRLRQFT